MSRLVEQRGALPHLVSIPRAEGQGDGRWPLLCFLHGYDEGAPTPPREGLTRHGPLAGDAAPAATDRFVVVAPRMPVRGDHWRRYAGAVREIVERVASSQPVDATRMYLTGFSFGGNGVFDLASVQRDLWAALWAVDPTRAPPADPGRPVWLSAGEVSRRAEQSYRRVLRMLTKVLHGDEAPEPPVHEDRVYRDDGEDHVGTARSAYGGDRVYDWLLSKRLTRGA